MNNLLYIQILMLLYVPELLERFFPIGIDLIKDFPPGK
jgi:hypothetical protein